MISEKRFIGYRPFKGRSRPFIPFQVFLKEYILMSISLKITEKKIWTEKYTYQGEVGILFFAELTSQKKIL